MNKKIPQALEKLSEHHRESEDLRKQRSLEAKSLEKEIIKSIFLDIPALHSFEIDFKEEHGYNGYYTNELHFLAINSVPFKDQGLTTEIEYLDSNHDRPAYKSWLVEAKLTKEEMDTLALTLMDLDTFFFDGKPLYTREEYLGEGK